MKKPAYKSQTLTSRSLCPEWERGYFSQALYGFTYANTPSPDRGRQTDASLQNTQGKPFCIPPQFGALPKTFSFHFRLSGSALQCDEALGTLPPYAIYNQREVGETRVSFWPKPIGNNFAATGKAIRSSPFNFLSFLSAKGKGEVRGIVFPNPTTKADTRLLDSAQLRSVTCLIN